SDPNPFFHSCSFAYDPSSGELDISFFDPILRLGPSGAPLGAGIPTLPDGCSTHPDLVNADFNCTASGHFGIILNDVNGNPTTPPPPDGGWRFDPNNPVFPDGPVVFTVTQAEHDDSNGLSLTPEPSTFVLFGAAIAACSFVGWRRRQRPVRL